MAPLGANINHTSGGRKFDVSGRTMNTPAIDDDEEQAMDARDRKPHNLYKEVSCLSLPSLEAEEDDKKEKQQEEESVSSSSLGMFGVGMPVKSCDLLTFGAGEEVQDPCIFFRYYTHARDDKLEFGWAIVPKYSRQLHDTLLNHTSPLLPFYESNFQDTAACVGVSSSIFVIGGIDGDSQQLTNVSSRSIDTKTGKFTPWVPASSMWYPKLQPAAVCLFNGMIVVLDGDSPSLSPPDGAASFVEVLGAKRDGWIPMKAERPQGLRGSLTAHAIPDSQLVLFHDRFTPFLYEYDVLLDRCSLRSSNLGGRGSRESSVLVDEILYTLNANKPGALFGLDINNPNATQKRVKLTYPFDEEVWWVPQSTWKFEHTPEAFLVGLGKNRLAMVWSLPVAEDLLCIWCTKWAVYKNQTEGGDLEFYAAATSRTRYYALAGGLTDCVPLSLSACSANSKTDFGSRFSQSENQIVSEHRVMATVARKDNPRFHVRKFDSSRKMCTTTTIVISNDWERAMDARDRKPENLFKEVRCLSIPPLEIEEDDLNKKKQQENGSFTSLGMFGVGLPPKSLELIFSVGEEAQDPCIFLRYSTRARDGDKLEHGWTIIPKYSRQLHDKLLDHTSLFSPFYEPIYQMYAAPVCASSSSVFVIGGNSDSQLLANVSSIAIDTRTGKFIPPTWSAPDMHYPRTRAAAVHLSNGKIVVMGGISPSPSPVTGVDAASFVEVLGVKRDRWIPMKAEKPQGLSGSVIAHAIPEKQLVLFHDSRSPFLYEYDVLLDRCSLRSSNLGGHSRTREATLLLDGILYYLDEGKPAALFALDINNPHATPKRVTLSYPFDEEVWWVPQSTCRFELTPDAFLVGLGKNRLAMVWSLTVSEDLLCIWCTKWVVHKNRTEGGELEVLVVATSRTRYYSLALTLKNFVPLPLSACKYQLSSFLNNTITNFLF